MMVINQHTNVSTHLIWCHPAHGYLILVYYSRLIDYPAHNTQISHPKVISIPLGIAYNIARAVINEAKLVLASDEK